MRDEDEELERLWRAHIDRAFHVLHMRAEEGCRLLVGHGEGGCCGEGYEGLNERLSMGGCD